ncbi:unnamed protein product, partial [Discosporangium mesarthrocarpum]
VQIVKSARDERSYRHMVLSNGLEVVVVSDPTTETAAASMHINAGHMQDPDELAGMAHFHEHMLFLGTEKHPEEGSFEKFLTQHGGSSNAYTSLETTNYYFSIKASHLREASDRFAQFFMSPLFSESAMEREMQAVDSEHKNNLNNDEWRIFQQVLKATANQKHPFSKFGTGNAETLRASPKQGVDTRQSLINFHEKYYSANTMRLCVLGMEDLDTLEDWVRETFSGIRNTAAPSVHDYGGDPAFGRGQLGTLVTVVPVMEVRRLMLSWPLPPRRQTLQSKPTTYVSHLLGHEGEGSLHSLLQSRGWASGVAAGSAVSVADFQLFRLSVSLTEKGLEHVEEVAEMCYRYIDLLRADPPRRHYQ